MRITFGRWSPIIFNGLTPRPIKHQQQCCDHGDGNDDDEDDMSDGDWDKDER